MQLVFLIAALGSLLSGWDIGTMGGALGAIATTFDLTPGQQGLVVGVALLGAAIGASTCGRPSTRFGARRVTLAAALLYAVGAIGAALAPTFAFLLAARLLIGLGFGIAATLVPVFLADIAPARHRGTVVSLAALGIALAIVLGYLVTGAAAVIAVSWRFPVAFAAIPALATAVGLAALPNGPHWSSARG
jgi:MFS family permease